MCSELLEMFWKYILKYILEQIWKVLENFSNKYILKCFPNKSENLFNHSKDYEVFSSISWERFVNIFFQHTVRCFQTNLNVSEQTWIVFNRFNIYLEFFEMF